MDYPKEACWNKCTTPTHNSKSSFCPPRGIQRLTVPPSFSLLQVREGDGGLTHLFRKSWAVAAAPGSLCLCRQRHPEPEMLASRVGTGEGLRCHIPDTTIPSLLMGEGRGGAPDGQVTSAAPYTAEPGGSQQGEGAGSLIAEEESSAPPRSDLELPGFSAFRHWKLEGGGGHRTWLSGCPLGWLSSLAVWIPAPAIDSQPRLLFPHS